MQLKGLPGTFYKAGKLSPTLSSPGAAQRAKAIELWETLRVLGLNTTQAALGVGVPRATLYRWRRRLRRDGPSGLEEGSRVPKSRRKPTWSPLLAQAVMDLRQRYPGWGKDKLAVLLRRQGCGVSVSMVGRILTDLRRRRLLKEPPRYHVSAKKRRPKRPYAIRKPKEYQALVPGDIVQVDTLDLRPLPGLILKQFTARDVVSRWDVIEVFRSATAGNAAQFLQAMKARFPFPLRAIQVDGGSEFMASFEEACRREGLHLFVLPPCSPKLNGHVERAQRTHTEEFWECYDEDLELAAVRPALRRWEEIYNTYRPHQSLAWLTPSEYLAKCHPGTGHN